MSGQTRVVLVFLTLLPIAWAVNCDHQVSTVDQLKQAVISLNSSCELSTITFNATQFGGSQTGERVSIPFSSDTSLVLRGSGSILYIGLDIIGSGGQVNISGLTFLWGHNTSFALSITSGSTVFLEGCTFNGNPAGGLTIVNPSRLVSIHNSSFSACGNLVTAQYEGGFYLANGSNCDVSISHSIFRDNVMTNAMGLGFVLEGTFKSIIISNSDFLRNIGAGAGGFYFPTGSTAKTFVVQDCLFDENESNAVTSPGGGAGFLLAGDVEESVTVNRNYFSRNTAIFQSTGGGGFQIFGSTPVLYVNSSYFFNNSAYEGSGFCLQTYNPSSHILVVLYNCTFDTNEGYTATAVYFNQQISTSSYLIDSCTFIKNNGDTSTPTFLFSNPYTERLEVRNSYFSRITLGLQAVVNIGNLNINSPAHMVIFDNVTFDSNPSGAIVVGTHSPLDNLIVRNSKFIENSGLFLGNAIGITSTVTNFTVLNSLFTGQTSRTFGGAIAVLTAINVKISGCTFTNNSALAGYDGGAIFIEEAVSVELEDNYFEGNFATQGGAVGILTATPIQISLIRNRFDNNVADHLGGCIFFNSVAAQGSQLVIVDSVFHNNSALYGGVLQLTGDIDAIVLSNVTASSNTARSGAVIYLQNSDQLRSLSINHSTFCANTGSETGAMNLQIPIRDLSIINSIFSRNEAITGFGGALSLQGILRGRLYNITFDENLGLYGGAIALIGQSKNVTFEKIEMLHNRAHISGGALYVQDQATLGTIGIINSNISYNTANRDGGGFELRGSSGDILISASSFSFNSASGNGGAMYTVLRNTMVILSSSTMTYNNASGSGGAVYVVATEGSTSKRAARAEMRLSRDMINGNRAEGTGGGMSVGGGATVTVSEGSITGNTASGGGDSAVVQPSGSVQMSGVENGGSLLITSASTFIANNGTTGANVQCDTGQAERSSDGSYSCVTRPPKNIGLIVGLTLGLLFIVILVSVVGFFIWRNIVHKKAEEEQSIVALTSALGKDQQGIIDYDELKNVREVATTDSRGVMVAEWRAIQVSIKQIDGKLGYEELSGFMKEVAVLRDMKRHPNVVLFLGVTVPPQPLSFVTEYADGGSLSDLLKSGREIDYKVKLQYMAQIALGMNHLHSEGIIHKDLSTENILITKSIMKVAGFGLSQLKAKSKLERLGKSAKYMAPECISSELQNRETDVYAFSILVWELLHESEPYPFCTSVEIAVSVTQGGRPPVDSSPLGMLLSDCWSESPNVRPTFNDICIALERMGTISREDRDEEIPRVEGNHYSGIGYRRNNLVGPEIFLVSDYAKPNFASKLLSGRLLKWKSVPFEAIPHCRLYSPVSSMSPKDVVLLVNAANSLNSSCNIITLVFDATQFGSPEMTERVSLFLTGNLTALVLKGTINSTLYLGLDIVGDGSRTVNISDLTFLWASSRSFAVEITGASSIFVEGCTFNGNHGGGLTIAQASQLVVIYNSTFSGCGNQITPQYVSGFYLANSSSCDVLVSHSIFWDNVMPNATGGGFTLDGTFGSIIVSDCDFRRNIAAGGCGFYYTLGSIAQTFLVEDSFFDENYSYQVYSPGGGAGFLLAGDVEESITVNRNHFSGNTAVDQSSGGGGFQIFGATPVLYVNSSLFFNNSAFEGSGFCIQTLSVQYDLFVALFNCSFDANEGYTAAAIFFNQHVNTTTYEIDSCNFINNNGDASTPTIFFGNGLTDRLEMRNCYFSENTLDLQATVDVGNMNLNSPTEMAIFDNVTFESNPSGAILVVAPFDHLLISNCQFIGNTDLFLGNAIAVTSTVTNFTVLNSLFTGQTSRTFGGAVAVLTAINVKISGCTFTNNSALAGYDGGAIFIEEAVSVELEDNYFEGNFATQGGAVGILTAAPIQIRLIRNRFDNNAADHLGGCIFFNSVAAQGSQLVIVDSVFHNNSALYGGVLQLTGDIDAIVLSNVTASSNTARSGAVIYLQNSDQLRLLSIKHSTFCANFGSETGAINLQIPIRDLSIINSIFSRNEAITGFSGALSLQGILRGWLYNITFDENLGLYGGAIALIGQSKNITFEKIEMLHNRAQFSGGALYVQDQATLGTIGFIDSNISYNTANRDGGGFELRGSNGDILISASSFSFNSASGNGGAMNTVLRSTMVILSSSTMTYNNASASGGAVYVVATEGSTSKRAARAEMRLSRDKMSGNRAGGTGGGMSVGGGATVTVSEGSITGNTAGGGGDSADVQPSGSVQMSGVENGGSLLITSASNFIAANGTTGADVQCGSGQAERSSDGSYSCVTRPPKNIGLIVGLTLGLLFIILVSVVGFFVWRNIVHKKAEEEQSIVALTSALGKDQQGIIDYDELKNVREVATADSRGVMVAEWRAIQVSIKQIDGKLGYEELSGFMKEVAVLRDMKRHPNVVLFLGVTVPPQPLSFVTEYADGGSLSDLLKSGREIDYKVKLQYMAQIALGMNHLHSEGIIHKELSAENILITKSTMKVAGFGLSQLKARSKVEWLKKSAKYMASESISSEIQNRETDVYAFSILIWELLHGAEPYSTSTPIEIVMSVTHGGRPSVDDSPLGMLLKDCWAESPDIRLTFNVRQDDSMQDKVNDAQDICIALERMGTISREDRDDEEERWREEKEPHYSGMGFHSGPLRNNIIVENHYSGMGDFTFIAEGT
ncbi:hypothetical protein PROFUN_04648 [Planoprotostelium fungivorum]|uniref:Protein kinase domain-containing protein n=1 Tax=Planoprotostelium fungivorum TaxID=1890364 RepID=A0A2P6NUI1_9EUKA|nr:hypothetical protein PROFUN_04648 [Planoprotostelium fungivorum]